VQSFAEALNAYTRDHPFDAGNGDSETVLDQLYHAYAESHESDPPEISNGFKELECFLETLPLDDNNAVFNLCCRLCTAYEEKAFRHAPLGSLSIFLYKEFIASVRANFFGIHSPFLLYTKICSTSAGIPFESFLME